MSQKGTSRLNLTSLIAGLGILTESFVAVAMRSRSLYYWDCQHCEIANVVVLNEDLWHRRYGHLNSNSLKRLISEDL